MVVTEPGYPVPERGAEFAGARVVALPLLEAQRVPARPRRGPGRDLGSHGASLAQLARTTRRERSRRCRSTRRRASSRGATASSLAADEAYSELWFDEPPASALQLDDWTNVAVFNTLSKRSSMTGYRSGFVAGDPELIAALRQFRPNIGTAPQEFVQRASVVAWGDEAHVERAREAYRRKRRLLLDVFERVGLRDAGGPATMYLWVAVPDGETSEELATRLLEHGVLVTPGSFLGPSGEGYVRFALVPTEDECERAVELLAGAF